MVRKKSGGRSLIEGKVFAIPLKAGDYAFAVVCRGLDCAFFNYRALEPEVPLGLLSIPIAFRTFVASDAPKSGNWIAAGEVTLAGTFADYGRYLHKPIGSAQSYIMVNGVSTPANAENCHGLEIASTWFSFHIEERLEDLFEGRENSYLAAIRRQLAID